jgi:hypothetical protein
MELFNFSAGESKRINRALTFISQQEVDLGGFTGRTLVVKTENFEDACDDVARTFPELGLESIGARLVFNTAKEGIHKILVNKDAISGLSYIHTLVGEVVHLGNLSRFTSDHGNIYRLEPEQAIARYYYEFLLWTKFQAMKIASRAHALMAWHEVNGEEPPSDGRYQFAQVNFPGEGVRAALTVAEQAENCAAWRDGLWGLLAELTVYFGRLAFYQQEPRPLDLDGHFPADRIEPLVGMDNCLAFYAALLRARNYPAWLAEKQAIRQAIVAMQEQGGRRFNSAT